MAYTVGGAFATFFDRINLSGDYHSLATSRRDHIVSLLKNHFTINDAFSTGSIPRYTGVTGYADLDVMVVLHYGRHVKGSLPSQVLQTVRDVISQYKTGVRKNGQAVTLFYQSWPDVDIVPVVKIDSGGAETYEVPNMNREEWLTSRPKVHDDNLLARNKSFGEEFKKIIKMVKWWNHYHSELMQSYHIEVLAYRALTDYFLNFPWAMYRFFEEAAKLAESPLYYEGDFADKYLFDDYATRAEIVKRLSTARDKANDAWYLTYDNNSQHDKAIGIWRQIFGDKFPTYG
jgi:hypothetical protein